MEDQTEFSNLKIAEYGAELGTIYGKMYRSADVLFGRQYLQYPVDTQFPENSDDTMDDTFRRTFLTSFQTVRGTSKGTFFSFLLEGFMRLLLLTLAVSGVAWLGYALDYDCSPYVLLGYVFIGYVVGVLFAWNTLRLMFIAVINKVHKRKYNRVMLEYKVYRDSQKKSVAMRQV